MYVLIYIRVNMCIFMYIYICMYLYICLHVCIYINMFCVSMHICIYICICMYMCVWTHRHIWMYRLMHMSLMRTCSHEQTSKKVDSQIDRCRYVFMRLVRSDTKKISRRPHSPLPHLISYSFSLGVSRHALPAFYFAGPTSQHA